MKHLIKIFQNFIFIACPHYHSCAYRCQSKYYQKLYRPIFVRDNMLISKNMKYCYWHKVNKVYHDAHLT